MSLFSLFKNSNPRNPQTLIVGDDDFLNNYVAASFVRDPRFRQFEAVRVDCESEGLATLIAALTESSLFASQKIITVKHPFFLTGKSSKKYQRQLAKLNNIFAHVNESGNVVVIIASYPQIDHRKKISKIILRHFNQVATSVRPYEVTAIVKAIIASEGYQIAPAALKLLVTRSDQVMDTILSNYRKLKMIANQHVISEQDVAQNVDLSLAQNIFAILSSAFRGQFAEASRRLDDQLRQGASPVQLLAVFENQLEVLLLVKILAQRGRQQNQIVKELNVHPYRVQLALRSHLSVARLASLLKQAIDLDYYYKNGHYQSAAFLRAYLLNI